GNHAAERTRARADPHGGPGLALAHLGGGGRRGKVLRALLPAVRPDPRARRGTSTFRAPLRPGSTTGTRGGRRGPLPRGGVLSRVHALQGPCRWIPRPGRESGRRVPLAGRQFAPRPARLRLG